MFLALNEHSIQRDFTIETEKHMTAIRTLLEGRDMMLTEAEGDHLKSHADKVLSMADAAIERARNSDSVTAKQMILKPIATVLLSLLGMFLGATIFFAGGFFIGYMIILISEIMLILGIVGGIVNTIKGLGIDNKMKQLQQQINTAKADRAYFKKNSGEIYRLEAKAKELENAVNSAETNSVV